MKERRKAIRTIVVAVMEWLALVCIYDASFLPYCKDYSALGSFVFLAVFTLGLTMLLWYCKDFHFWLKSFWEDDEDGVEDTELVTDEASCAVAEERSQIAKSLIGTGVLTLAFLVAMVLETKTDRFALIYSTDILIGAFHFPKKYLVGPVSFILFPLLVRSVFYGMAENKNAQDRMIMGGIQLLILTVISYLLFIKLPFNNLLNLAVIEILTVAAGIRKYLWNDSESKKALHIGLGTYATVWLILLCLSYQPYFGYEYICELYDRGNWGAASIITILYVLFLIGARKLLGKRAMDNRYYLVYQAAWWHLVMQTILGTIHALGILNLPISLPFTGNVGLYIDTIGFALLLACGWEEKDYMKPPVLTIVNKNR